MSINVKPLAKELLKDQPEYTSFLGASQYTLPRLPDGSYNHILNQRGEELLDRALQMVKNREYTGVFTNWEEVRSPSGFWQGDQKCYDLMVTLTGEDNANLTFGSNTSDVKDVTVDKEVTILNSWNNSSIQGRLEGFDYGGGQETSLTSRVTFIGEDWVYTSSGSLYRLEGPGAFLPILRVGDMR